MYKTQVRWVRKKRDTGDRNFRRSRFRPFPGGFMSLAVANDFAFPNEDIRWGSIRRMTFDLMKTGFHRIREEIWTERCRAWRKNIDDRFRSLMLTQISPAFPHRWRSSSKCRLQFLPIFFESPLNCHHGSLIRVLIWLPIKSNIPPDCDFWI